MPTGAWGRKADVHDLLALLGLGSVERPRLHRPADHDGVVGHVEAAPVDAGDPVRRRPVVPRQLRCRRIRLPPADRLGPSDQAGTWRICGALAAGADRGRRNTRLARWIWLRSVPELSEHQRGPVRPARMVGDRSPSAAARPPIQLRQEGRGLRPAGLRRAADNRSRADRAETLGSRATDLFGRCR